ncbi:hypothetical protein OG401_31305 [Kitasatospora purpeofusca]|uniref:hypothetical protein n=1 Tax=Kitasatospora purpeofusca TaxID=67352 RepID=UPI00224ED290|nr:hypothetical protein [Kitasatospora purpeofusca]MCX4688730.1 hypothetical protein [Kitasatospora purpeofusca]
MSLPRHLRAFTAAAVATVLTLGTAQLAAGAPPAPTSVSTTSAASAVAASAPLLLPTDEQLRAALLTTAELGPDFTEVPVDPNPSPEAGASPVAGCDALRALLNRNPSGASAQGPHQEAQFDGPDGSPMVTESLSAEEASRLDADFATVSGAFADCHSITFTDNTGAAVTFSVTPIALGDRAGAPAVRLDGDLAGVRLNGYLGIERLGEVALAYGYFQRDSDDSQLASLYYRAAVAKAERTLGVKAGATAGSPGTATGSPGTSAAPGSAV